MAAGFIPSWGAEGSAEQLSPEQQEHRGGPGYRNCDSN